MTWNSVDWTSLTNGLIGSVLGAIVTFSLAVTTIRPTQRLNDAQSAERRTEREEARRHAGVAKVIGTLQGLVTEIRWYPVRSGQASATMLEAAMRFYLSEHARNPNVAAWMLTQYEEYENHLKVWRQWWRPRRRAEALTAAGDQIGQVVAALILWASGQLAETDFARPERPAAELAGLGRDRLSTASSPPASDSVSPRPTTHAL